MAAQEASGVRLVDIAARLGGRWKLLLGAPLLVGAAVYIGSAWLPPGFTAKASFMPPQQQNSLSTALASLGPLVAGLGMSNTRNPADQYVSLMRSVTVSDRMLDRFNLIKLYKADSRRDARMELEGRVRIALGRKDGLVYIEVDAGDRQLAADMANAYIDELRLLLNRLAVGEAQQRRVFFDSQLKQTRDRLTQAQLALQQAGFSQGALRAEPKAAAEGYARLRAEVTSAEVRVQSMRGFMSDQAPEMRAAQARLTALRDQLNQMESRSSNVAGDASYIERYREFKYQETLFELFARQYELARVDESREGALVQIVDVAQPPEKQSAPRKARLAAGAAVVVGLAIAVYLLYGLARERLAPSNA